MSTSSCNQVGEVVGLTQPSLSLRLPQAILCNDSSAWVLDPTHPSVDRVKHNLHVVCYLHPAPCTLHPTPYTLHPTPYTRHLEPLIPNLNGLLPAPFTPHICLKS